MSSKLPKRQKQLYDMLFGKGDVPIPLIYQNLRGIVGDDVQYQQRYIAPYITMLNRNLTDRGLKVEPGALKNTYRLVSLTA